ncbi:hypothetical protein HDU98_005897 [Podochytrium sp. JEL0797]|nr:hypothetical protein HDU98_005897 [Podochytrium sp. JEL0797]
MSEFEDDDDFLPHSSDLFSEDASTKFTARLETSAPRTLVNMIPMEGSNFIAPFVPCTLEIATAACLFANVNLTTDILCDLGCGDGRILQQALLLPTTTLPSARVIGVELDPHLSTHLRSEIAPQYPPGVFTVIESNMFDVDLCALGVTVMVLYLLPMGLDKLKSQLETWLKAGEGRRVVTITYSIPGWNCDRGKEVNRQWLFYYDKDDIKAE